MSIDSLIAELQSFYKTIHAEFLKSLEYALHDDPQFRESFTKWAGRQHEFLTAATDKSMVTQAANIWTNRLLLYKMLEAQKPEIIRNHLRPSVDDPAIFQESLRRCFDDFRDSTCRAIFDCDSILDSIPLTKDLTDEVANFMGELDIHALAGIENDIIGQVYENIIPPSERRIHGQFYTPPTVVELMICAVVNSPRIKILDPSCGTGSFLVQAYHKLTQMLRENNPSATDPEIHHEVLESIWGIDINRISAQLAAINLAVRNPRELSKNIHVIVGDFFSIVPNLKPETYDEKSPLLTVAKERETISDFQNYFDVIVANPPYTEQREIGDEKYKHHVRKVALTFDGVPLEFNANAGIYAYFITHSTRLLKNRGKLSYIISDSWMSNLWGKDLQKFLLENYAVKAIITFDRDVFDAALVETVILIAEKLQGEQFREERNSNSTRFIKVKRPLHTTKILKLVGRLTDEHNLSVDLQIVKQADLYNESNWTKFFRNTKLLKSIESHHRMIRLGDIAEISYLFKEGGYEFFVMKKEKATAWGIEPEFLRPIISSPTHCCSIELLPSDIREFILLVNKPKNELEDSKVLNYLRHGEERKVTVKRGRLRGTVVNGFQNLPTFKIKQPWYSLRKGKIPHIILPAYVRNRFFAVKNSGNALATANFYGLILKNEGDVDLILAYLNSSTASFMIENHAKTSLGRGLLDIRLYQLRELRVLDPSTLNDSEKGMLRDAVFALYRRKFESPEFNEAKQKLDYTIFDILKFNKKDRSQMIEELYQLRENRNARIFSKVLIQGRAD